MVTKTEITWEKWLVKKWYKKGYPEAFYNLDEIWICDNTKLGRDTDLIEKLGTKTLEDVA